MASNRNDERAAGAERGDPRRRDSRSPAAGAGRARDGGDERGAADATPGADEPRRRFLSRLAVAAGTLAGLLVAIPGAAFLFAPVRRRESGVWRSVGAVERFPVGRTVKVTYLDPEPLPWAGFAARSAAWVRREAGERLTAFSIYCTHTACPVRWVEDGEMFLCPCHGGAFNRDGSVAGGPPPRPLDRLPIRVRDGQVEIQVAGVPTPG